MKTSGLFAEHAVEIVGEDVDVTALAYDSRRVSPGGLFAAWQGTHADGHGYIDSALQAGAAAVLCERLPEHRVRGITYIVARDARRALAHAARRFYADPAAELCMVGVTGTNGKTTTTHLIEGVLKAAGHRPAVIGTLGARYDGKTFEGSLTTPESLELVAMLRSIRNAGCNAVSMEVSSHALAQGRVDGVQFDVGVFTNLTHDHLDFHGTLEAYFEAKALLSRERLKPHGRSVINLDDPWMRRLHDHRSLGFSTSADQQGVCAQQVRLTPEGIFADVRLPDGKIAIHSPMVGRFNLENILAAIAVGHVLGAGHDTLVQGIAAVHAVSGRLERVGQGQPLVLVDYAHTPDALQKALAAVREITRGRVICVFGCGGDRDPHKRAPMGEVAGGGAEFCVLTNDNPRTENPELIARAVEQGLIKTQGTYVVELDRALAIERALKEAMPDDTVLIAGKGHEPYQIVGTTKLPFDDRDVARRLLGKMRGAL